MISLRLLVCFFTFWYLSHAFKTALLFNCKEKKLVEIDPFDSKTKCESCIGACPTTSHIIKEKLLNDGASVTKNSIFLRQIYPSPTTSAGMRIQICEKLFSPGLVWDTQSRSFNAGYEMYYEEGLVDLTSTRYDHYVQVVDGKPIELKQPPSEHEIKIYKEALNTKFEVVGQPGKRLVFYFIDVLFFDIADDEKARAVTFVGDTINDYRHQIRTISRCNTYFWGDSTDESGEKQETEAPIQIPTKKRRTDYVQFDNKLPLKRKTITDIMKTPANRLVKTQILPMRMFHTLAARLATCMYLNIAFIWETIANIQLRKIDLFLYALYRLFPSDVELNFGVGGELREIDPVVREEIASKHQLLTKFPVPELIFRFVDIAVAEKLHGAVVVIHNNVKPVPVQDKDRICPHKDELESWGAIRNINAAIGFSYVCKQTRDVFKKLGLDENAAPVGMIPLQLDQFPHENGTDGLIDYKSVVDKIDNELNHIKKLQIEY